MHFARLTKERIGTVEGDKDNDNISREDIIYFSKPLSFTSFNRYLPNV